MLLWRSVAARAAAVAGLVLLVVSMGPHLQVAGHDTAHPAAVRPGQPRADHRPGERHPVRDGHRDHRRRAARAGRRPGPRRLPRRRRVAFWIGLAVALVPVAAEAAAGGRRRRRCRAFLADGHLAAVRADDRSLVPVPLPEVTTGRDRDALGGAVRARVPGAARLLHGPGQPAGRTDTGSWNAPRRFTVRPAAGGSASTAGCRGSPTADYRHAIDDLVYWRAAVVVLVPGSRNGDAARRPP